MKNLSPEQTLPLPQGQPLSARLKFWSTFLRMLPPRTPGKVRLARRVIGENCPKNVIVHAQGHDFLLPSLHDSIAYTLFCNGSYEPNCIAVLKKFLRPGDTFVDIGANIGLFTVLLSKSVGPNGRIIAIEAAPQVAPYLHQNLRLNDVDNVTVCQMLATSAPGNVSFYPPSKGRFGGGSIGWSPETLPITLPADTLENILAKEQVSRLRAIKMDVEGAELNVLKGAKNILTGPNAPLILFERYVASEDDLRIPRGKGSLEFLQELGFTVSPVSSYVKGEKVSNVNTSTEEMFVAVPKSRT